MNFFQISFPLPNMWYTFFTSNFIYLVIVGGKGLNFFIGP